MKPRWRKVLADLWGNLARFILVTLSLAIGMFSVGMIAGGFVTTSQDMQEGYDSIHPADIRVVTSLFDDNLIERVRRLEGVTAVDGEKRLRLQMLTGDGKWQNMTIRVIPEDGQQLDQVEVLEGAMPGEKEMALDNHRLDEIQMGIGDSVTIQMASGKQRTLPVTGLVRDQTIGVVGTSYFVAPTYGYITFESLPWFEEPLGYGALLIEISPELTPEEITQLSDEIIGLVEESGRDVTSITHYTPKFHPNSGYVQAVSGLLALLGFLSVFLSGFLVFNAMAALFSQQIQYIGIMKAIGARKKAIIQMYLLFILIFGLIALLIAIPLSAFAAAKLGQFLGTRLNYYAGGMRYVPLAVILQIVIALILPQAAGIIPILKAARISVQKAITTTSIDADNFGKSKMDQQIEKIKHLSRPMLISLRNTFRRKGRLALTLITLSLGGAVFIATFNVRASVEAYIDQVAKYILADVSIDFDQNYRIQEISQVAMEVEGVEAVEPRTQIGRASCRERV